MREEYPKMYLYRRVVQAKLFIDENFAGNINLSDIADEAYFSKFHFTRLFKSIYGKTPHQYLTTVRLERTKILLQTKIPISEVCFLVGFDSISSFTGLFKRINKITPSLYQKQMLQRQIEIGHSPLNFIPNCFAEQKGWNKKSNIEEVQ